MYPGMAKTARGEGFTEIADWFETLAKRGAFARQPLPTDRKINPNFPRDVSYNPPLVPAQSRTIGVMSRRAPLWVKSTRHRNRTVVCRGMKK